MKDQFWERANIVYEKESCLLPLHGAIKQSYRSKLKIECIKYDPKAPLLTDEEIALDCYILWPWCAWCSGGKCEIYRPDFQFPP